MPDIIGRNIRAYPSPHADNGLMILLVVMTRREHNGHLKAYAGIVQDRSLEFGNAYYDTVQNWVAGLGNPIGFDEAKTHFPGIDEATYGD